MPATEFVWPRAECKRGAPCSKSRQKAFSFLLWNCFTLVRVSYICPLTLHSLGYKDSHTANADPHRPARCVLRAGIGGFILWLGPWLCPQPFLSPRPCPGHCLLRVTVLTGQRWRRSQQPEIRELRVQLPISFKVPIGIAYKTQIQR